MCKQPLPPSRRRRGVTAAVKPALRLVREKIVTTIRAAAMTSGIVFEGTTNNSHLPGMRCARRTTGECRAPRRKELAKPLAAKNNSENHPNSPGLLFKLQLGVRNIYKVCSMYFLYCILFNVSCDNRMASISSHRLYSIYHMLSRFAYGNNFSFLVMPDVNTSFHINK
jgi:hypothetical protein